MTLEDLRAAPPARLPFPITRSLASPVEAKGDGVPTMVGHFSTFNDWYEVDSLIEGHFLERVAPGAFRKTIAESRGSMKVLFNHGQDTTMGNQVLGDIEDLREDDIGPAYEVPLFDGVPTLIVSGLRAGAYGSSHRFTAEKDVWDNHPEPSDYNPAGLPERTITEARVYEFGPVTFPADPKADVGIRSTTDDFYRRSKDPEQFEALLRSAQVARTPRPTQPPAGTPQEPPSPDTAAPLAAAVAPSTQPTTTKETRSVSDISPEDRVSEIAELKETIVRMAGEHTGRMPADVQAAYDANKKRLNELELDQQAWELRKADVARLSQETRTTERTYEAPEVIVRKTEADIYDLAKIRSETRSREEYDSKVQSNALRSIDSLRSVPKANLDALVDIIENHDEGTDGKGEVALRVLATGSPVYKRAFSKYLKGQTALWTQEEARAAALAVTATTTTGGYAVPYVFDPTLIRIGVWTAQNPFRAACRTVTITNGNVWKAVTVGAVTAAYGTEASAATEQGPTFGQPSYQVQTAKAFATLSIETLEDRPDITGELTGVFAEAKDTLEENEFAVGTGATVHPKGMFYAASYTPTNTATNDTTALSDTQLVEAALPLRFRAKAEWFMNRSTLRQLMALDTGWRYFSGAGIQFAGNQNPVTNDRGNTGIKLLGYDVWEVPSAVSTLTTDQALIAGLVDPTSYIIVDRIGMNVEVIPQMLDGATPSFPTLQRGVICYWRNYAAPHTADAGRILRVQ